MVFKLIYDMLIENCQVQNYSYKLI